MNQIKQEIPSSATLVSPNLFMPLLSGDQPDEELDPSWMGLRKHLEIGLISVNFLSD